MNNATRPHPIVRKPSASYAGKKYLYNPLWKHIYRSLSDRLLETDAKKTCSMYITNRIEPDGITEFDVSEHLRRRSGNLLIVRGQAGVGKTTFLHNAIAQSNEENASVLIWIDALTEVDQTPDHTSVVNQVKELIQFRIGKEAMSRSKSIEWHKFLLERNGTLDGLEGIFLSEIENHCSILETSKSHFMDWIFCMQNNKLQYTRSLIAFLKTLHQLTTRIIIDNIDQLSASEILEIVDYADLLAKGAGGMNSQQDDLASVVVALRPVSFGPRANATRLFTMGNLFAPNIADVFMRRLEIFLSNFAGRTTRGYIISDDDGREVDIREIMEHDVTHQSAQETIKHLLLKVAEAALSESTPYGSSLIVLVQQLANFNTRRCLLATCQFLASGHLDWKGLTDVLAGRKRLHDALTHRKTLMTLILGVSAIYDTQSSWLVNLFNDGHPDGFGVLMRLRVLKAFRTTSGTLNSNQDEVARDLQHCFGYPLERVAHVCSDLLAVGVLEERQPNEIEITASGIAYIDRMLIDFQYLQHVLVDAYAPPEYLITCVRHDESASTRFNRVIQFTKWVRELEIKELANAIHNNQKKVYDKLFSDELICKTMAETLKESYDFLPKQDRDDAWTNLHRESQTLTERTSYHYILEEAYAALEGNETLPNQ